MQNFHFEKNLSDPFLIESINQTSKSSSTPFVNFFCLSNLKYYFLAKNALSPLAFGLTHNRSITGSIHYSTSLLVIITLEAQRLIYLEWQVTPNALLIIWLIAPTDRQLEHETHSKLLRRKKVAKAVSKIFARVGRRLTTVGVNSFAAT